MRRSSVILIALVLINFGLYSQESFDLNYGSSESEYFYYTFQTSEGKFISIGGKQNNFGPDPLSPLIIEIDNEGNITGEKNLQKTDTSYSIRYGIEKSNGDYLLFGILTDIETPFDFNSTYICEMSPDLNIVWEKIYPIPTLYNNHLLINFLMDNDSNLYIQGKADSSLNGWNNLLLTTKFDMNGNQLDFNFYPGWKDNGIYSDMIFNEDSTAIYLIGGFVRPPSYLNEFIEMDLDLNITNYLSVIDEDHYILTPLSLQTLPNGNIIQANRASVEPGADNDLYVKIIDQQLDVINDTLLFYPESVYLPTFKGLGFSDPNKIWVATFEGVPPVFSGSEVFRFHIFDSSLNLIGLKEYGGDTRYWFYNLLMCSDGGCLLTGSVPDYDGSQNANGYIIKVMPDDIITHAEDTPFRNDKDVMVFPNPFLDEIQIQTMRYGLTFNLYDLTGKMILANDIYNIPHFKIETGNLQAGFYFYSIIYKNHIIQTGKLIKE